MSQPALAPDRATAAPPRLSVVIASVNGWDLLGPTLRALDAQPERAEMQVIVVDAVGGETRRQIAEYRPAVELVGVDDRLAIPRLRFLGVDRARGEVVAILEDHGEVSPGWAAAALDAHATPIGAVGGPVENGRRGLVDWAAFFCEYTRYMGPLPEGETADLPGNNIAYRRPHLRRHAHLLDDGKWESWLNDRLRADGLPLRTSNQMVVRHIKPFRLGHFLAQRFHFSRSFAGMRREAQPPLRRVVYGCGSAVLPALLLARIGRDVLRKKRHLGAFAAASPLIVLFLVSGALGEMVGYLIGPGDSLERVE